MLYRPGWWGCHQIEDCCIVASSCQALICCIDLVAGDFTSFIVVVSLLNQVAKSSSIVFA